jgi:hypothetical protein
MVKTPRTRHSRTAKEPVTIDLAAEEVSRIEAEAAADNAAGSPEMQGPEQGPDAPAEPAPQADEPISETPAFERSAPEASAAETPAPEAPKPERPASRGGGLLAGLIGGVAALAIAAGLQFYGLLPGVAPTPAPQAAVDHGPAIAALEAEIAGIRNEVAALPAAGDGNEAFDQRIAAIEERVSGLASGLDSLRGEVAAIETAPATDGTPAAPVDLSAVETRIAALETALGEAREAMAPASALAAVEEAVAGLRAELDAGRDAQDAIAPRLDALDAAVATLSGKVEEQAEAPATAIIIAASSLTAAIDRGAPFTTELDTYAALVPDAPQLEGLRALAAAGVPTRAQLAAESDAAANAMIAAARPADPDAGIVDRLMGSMMGLVQVRPIGMVEGDGVPEIAARLDAAVASGDYERALAEFDTLPPEAKAAGEAFVARLRARHAADRLADEALAAALRA